MSHNPSATLQLLSVVAASPPGCEGCFVDNLEKEKLLQAMSPERITISQNMAVPEHTYIIHFYIYSSPLKSTIYNFFHTGQVINHP